MSSGIGTRVSRILGNDSAGDRTPIALGASATILGIYVACDGVLDIVTIQDAGGTPIISLACGADDTVDMQTPFIIDNGLLIVAGTGAATTIVTVIYRLST